MFTYLNPPGPIPCSATDNRCPSNYPVCSASATFSAKTYTNVCCSIKPIVGWSDAEIIFRTRVIQAGLQVSRHSGVCSNGGLPHMLTKPAEPATCSATSTCPTNYRNCLPGSFLGRSYSMCCSESVVEEPVPTTAASAPSNGQEGFLCQDSRSYADESISA